MKRKKDDMEELYTSWLAVWVLLDCMQREFYCEHVKQPTAEQVEQMGQRAQEMREHLEQCRSGGFLRLEDIDKGGGYAAIISGLSTIAERISSGGGNTADEWWELEGQILRIKVHAWAQKERALDLMREAARAQR